MKKLIYYDKKMKKKIFWKKKKKKNVSSLTYRNFVFGKKLGAEVMQMYFIVC